MIIRDTVEGIPLTNYTDTEANVEAVGSPVTGMLAVSTDTHLLGYYANSQWNWASGVHDIVGSQHTITGAQWSVVGATSTNTLGLFTPASDTSGGTEALLKSASDGSLTLFSLGIKTAPLAAPNAATVAGHIRIVGGEYRLFFEPGATPRCSLEVKTGGHLRFLDTSGTPHVVFAQSGRVGIGNIIASAMNPGAPLHLQSQFGGSEPNDETIFYIDRRTAGTPAVGSATRVRWRMENSSPSESVIDAAMTRVVYSVVGASYSTYYAIQVADAGVAAQTVGNALEIHADDLVPAGAISLSEMTAPSAPAANKSVFFCRDDGGDTQVCSRFNTGDIVVMAQQGYSNPAYTVSGAPAVDRTLTAMAASQIAVTPTNTSPWGYSSSAEAQAIEDEINNLVSDVDDLKRAVRGIIEDVASIHAWELA